jgi:hypothetical protein
MDTPDSKNEEQEKWGVDPIQLIIWGILLVAYGGYSIYQTINADIESNLIVYIMPNLILSIFGVMISVLGYKREKMDRKGN